MACLVLEVGTEEMPAVALPGALDQLREIIPAKLAAARVEFDSVRVMGTPRRLVVLVEGVAERQADEEREVRGPAWHVAFDNDGRPTNAALGFARKLGVDVSALTRQETPQGPYVVARLVDQGKPTQDAVGPLFEECLRDLSFPKTMRWGEKATRFGRPIRWILCLFEEIVVPVEFAGVQSSNRTWGHRYLAGGEAPVRHAREYLDTVRRLFVMLDPEERRRSIVEQGTSLAASVGGRVPWDEDLLLENIHLVEWPTCLLGHFEARFLELPRPVLVTAMKKHQRFFPVEDQAGKLLPYFVSVRNGGEAHLDKVRAGNEAVLKARFEDAQHFYEHDRTVPLTDMALRLERLLFQEKLGTMAAKRDRLVAATETLAELWGFSSESKALARRAAYLCKADLTSEMVIELPSLQGIMGREYALMQKEPEAVADAIAEHYKPRNAADSPPQTALGRLLAVTDRMDTLTGYAGLGITPTGSADPFGLRRAAQGVVEILADEPDAPPVEAMEAVAAEAYVSVNALELPLTELADALQLLFEQRLDAYLAEQDVRYDLRDAALCSGLSEGYLVQAVVARAHTLTQLSDGTEFVPFVQAAARTANILSLPSRPPTNPQGVLKRAQQGREAFFRTPLEAHASAIRRDLLTEPAEERLHDVAVALIEPVSRCAAKSDYVGVFKELLKLRDPVNTFFDDVLVMCENAQIRENRLSLLRLVDGLFRTLADFRKVVVG